MDYTTRWSLLYRYILILPSYSLLTFKLKLNFFFQLDSNSQHILTQGHACPIGAHRPHTAIAHTVILSPCRSLCAALTCHRPHTAIAHTVILSPCRSLCAALTCHRPHTAIAHTVILSPCRSLCAALTCHRPHTAIAHTVILFPCRSLCAALTCQKTVKQHCEQIKCVLILYVVSSFSSWFPCSYIWTL